MNNRFLSLFIIWGSLFLFAGPAYGTVADGVYAYEKGNYQQARVEWLPYAALGNTNALYNLGQLHRMGRGVETDYFKAKEYYLRAAEKDHVGAQRNLGILYYFGRVGKVDYTEALNWLTKAAISGDARSQLMTGTMYYNGEGGKQDNIQAYAWIMLAAQSGLGNAATALEKLDDAMMPEHIARAKVLAPDMINRQLSPDDVGLMIKQSDGSSPAVPALNTPEPTKTQTVLHDTSKAEIAPAPANARRDNFRVQLGSFRAEEIARKALRDLKNKFSDIIEDHQGMIEFADLGDKGIFYRLQLSPFESRSDASDLCARLKEDGQNCYVVKAP